MFEVALQWSKQLFKKLLNLKLKVLRLLATPLRLGNISKHWSVDYMKDTRLNGYVYDFSVGYDITSVDDIVDVHKYLMRVNKIV